MSEWISVEDRLPENTKPVIAARFAGPYDEIPYAAVCWFANGEFRVWLDGIEASNYDGLATITLDFDPLCWMPLREPPC